MHSHEKMIKKKSNEKNKKITLVANKFSRYNKRLMKASLYIYSTPKYNANIVKKSTKFAPISAKLSTQKTKWESMRSRQKNQRPKSM